MGATSDESGSGRVGSSAGGWPGDHLDIHVGYFPPGTSGSRFAERTADFQVHLKPHMTLDQFVRENAYRLDIPVDESGNPWPAIFAVYTNPSGYDRGVSLEAIFSVTLYVYRAKDEERRV